MLHHRDALFCCGYKDVSVKQKVGSASSMQHATDVSFLPAMFDRILFCSGKGGA